MQSEVSRLRGYQTLSIGQYALVGKLGQITFQPFKWLMVPIRETSYHPPNLFSSAPFAYMDYLDKRVYTYWPHNL